MEVMTLLSGILNVVFNKLGSEILQQIGMLWGLADNLDELKDVMEIIRAGLEAAEEQAIEDKQLSKWLRRIHDVAYDVDDLLHELRMKTEKYELKMNENKWDSRVSQGFSKRNPVFQLEMANKIKEFKGRFEELAKYKERFHFEKNLGKGVTLKNDHRMTISNTDTEKVIGREEDKETIRNEVTKIDAHQKVSIISIIGLGGLGKTTLAQLVYNDDVVQNHFKLRMWICVSQNFDTRRLMIALFEYVTGKKPDFQELSPLGEKIKELLKGQKFLLVLDDVWDHDKNEWEKFSSLLSVSEAGSKIIVTTRSRVVSRKLGSTFEHNVATLSDDDSWTLFKQRAFQSDSEELDPELVKIGKEILWKCGGVPLAVKALGSTLFSEDGIEGWKLVRDSNVWRHPEGDKVMTSLRLSYYHLPSHLKQCFTICSVFPKGHRIDKEQLIDLWIAHDMITLEDGVDLLEYNGKKCFSSLVQMSFLQDVDEGFNGRVTCRMHDLVHDLALSILGDEISHVVPEKTTDARKSYRYFSLIEQTGNVPPERLFVKTRAMYVANGDIIFGKPQKNAKNLRSITMECVNTKSMLAAELQIKNLRYLHMSGLECETLPEAISNIRSLQSLHITDSYHLREITKSIGKLKELRTLNLSGCVYLKCLPDSVCDCCMISTLDLTNCNLIEVPESIGRNKKIRVLRLCHNRVKWLPSGITALENLECLDLQDCREISELPEGMGNLKKLEVLNLEGCYSLCGLPAGFGQLTGLQKLGLFVVGAGEKSARISELGTLGKISGELTIGNIECVNDPGDASKVCLKKKAKIRDLTLQWGSGRRMEEGAKEAVAVLEGLEPPSQIERLWIDGYPGVRFAWWMLRQHDDDEGNCLGVDVPLGRPRQFQCLTVLTLYGFPQLKHLQGLVDLPCLKELELEEMLALESISWGPFPSLVEFYISGMPSLEELWTLADGNEGGRSMDHNHRRSGQVVLQVQRSSSNSTCFPCLSNLEIGGCQKLEAKPYLPSSLEFQCLTMLTLSDFPRLKRLQGLVELPCLEELHLRAMPALESISGGPFPSLVDFSIVEMPSLEELWTLDDGEEGGRSMDHNDCRLGQALLQVQISSHNSTCFPRLSHLHIDRCPKLKAKPYLPSSLESLFLEESNEQLLLSPFRQGQGCWSSNDVGLLPPSFGHLKELRLWRITAVESGCGWELLQHLTMLESLTVIECGNLTELPESMRCLPSLRSLDIHWCPALRALPEWLGELRSLRRLDISDSPCLSSLTQSLPHLATSLQELRIASFHALHQLPEWLWELRSLRTLELSFLLCLTCLPQSMRRLTSLERLRIIDCEGITSLPEVIQGLTALQELIIEGCPDLEERYETRKGQDWHLISHIPLVRLSCFKIKGNVLSKVHAWG